MSERDSQPEADGGVRARLRRAWSRLGRSTSEIHAESLERQAEAAGADKLSDCQLRAEVTLVGQISVLVLAPGAAGRGLEADLDDGTGIVRLVWLGRPSVPGIVAGRRLRVTGRLTLSEGRRTIFNPRYQLLPT